MTLIRTDSLGLEIDWEKFFKYTNTIEKHTTKYGKRLEKIEQVLVEKALNKMGVVTPKLVNQIAKFGGGVVGAVVWELAHPDQLADPHFGADWRLYNPDGSLFESEWNDKFVVSTKEGSPCE